MFWHIYCDPVLLTVWNKLKQEMPYAVGIPVPDDGSNKSLSNKFGGQEHVILFLLGSKNNQ